ncbi:hypothetical protein D6D01_10121 [Aureobasidium pullulans]|uniref:Uncharacterized protein n=1 Tax=Aureobasidium pullulans TaxID=5580 RepID=A0A4S9JNX3_AURPU|nr:hypothetical protein D6D01_10121 [Aureobasidium pullulans]
MDDPNVGPGTSFVAHYHEQHHLEPESELFVHQRAASDAQPGSHLRPRSFKAPNKWFVVWFRGRKANAYGTDKTVGAHVDLRFFVPVVAAVCLVVALTLIIYYALRLTVIEALSDAYAGPYDCAYVSTGVVELGCLADLDPGREASFRHPDLTWVSVLHCLLGASRILTGAGIDLIVFDNLSFTVAKAIDLAWNMLAGRGSQALAALVCYRVFTGVLLLATEQRGVSAETFAALVFSSTSIWCYGPTFQSVCRGKLGPVNKLAFVWILVSVTYLLFIATMVDLMTGYQAGQATWVNIVLGSRPWGNLANYKLPNGTLVDMQIGQYALIQDLYGTLPPSNVTMPDDETIFPTWTFYQNPYIGGGPVRTAVFPSATDSCIGNMLYQRCLDATRTGLYFINVTCGADGGWGDLFCLITINLY